MRPLLLLLVACACSGGGNGGDPAPPPPPPATPATGEIRVSGPSPFAPACGGSGGTAYVDSEVEPHLAVNPLDPGHLVAVWQQDRWSNGSARGLLAALSLDGGTTWTYSQARFSECSGGDFTRASDPWVTFGPAGTVYQSALATIGGAFADNSTSAILVSRSPDGGRAWMAPVAAIIDTPPFFNDKESITADPHDARFAYATWDRLRAGQGGPTYFARTTDGGATWEDARAIYDPGTGRQTIGNVLKVLPDGTLVLLFTWLQGDDRGIVAARLQAMRSTDRGATWSGPVVVAGYQPVGARDPDTGQRIRDGTPIASLAAGPRGELYAAWQDARFTGTHDAIVVSRSDDRGLTWSSPVRVSGADAAAFTPTVHVRADGTVGITYYDLRADTPGSATLLAEYWLARSSDGVAWSETRVAGPFDLRTAPEAAGALFLGDYMGLESAGTTFLALYARTTGSLTNRTDIFLARVPASAPAPAAPPAVPKRTFTGDPAFEARVSAHLARALAERREP